MRFFGLKTCDTCRKALGQIRAAGHAPQVIDLRADGINAVDLAMILTRFGDTAVNRASTTWRGLTDVQKALDTATLLVAHPTLLKRPVIEHAGGWTIGWAATTQDIILKS